MGQLGITRRPFASIKQQEFFTVLIARPS